MLALFHPCAPFSQHRVDILLLDMSLGVASAIRCAKVFETQEKNIKSYLGSVSQDPSKHHRFMKAVSSYVDKINAGKKRIRYRDGVRHAASLKSSHSRGRTLVGRWKQAVPVSKWSQCYPKVPPPPAEQLGYEVLDGQRQLCVIKDPGVTKPFHYDIEEFESTSINAETVLADVRSSDDEEAEVVLAARRSKALETFMAKADKNEGIHAWTTKELEDAALDAEREAASEKDGKEPTVDADDDASSDASDDMFADDNAFMRALDPFGASVSKPAPKAAPSSASGKAAAKPMAKPAVPITKIKQHYWP